MPATFISSRHQHSIEQLQSIDLMRKQDALSVKDELFVTTQMVVHGSPQAGEAIRRLITRSDHQGFQTYVRKLDRANRAIAAICHRVPLPKNQKIWTNLYSKERPVVFRHSHHPQKLLVIFGTMYNNFDLSYAVLLSMLSDLGVSILILKDCGPFNFLRGSSGFGNNLDGVAEGIQKIARDIGASRLYFAGFSSGSYAALYTSLVTRAVGYLGFSAVTDLSPHSDIPPPKFFIDDVRKRIDGAYLMNLRDMVSTAAPQYSGTIYYGDRSAVDTAHALNMRDLDNFHVIRLSDCSHNVPLHLIAEDQLHQKFAELVAR